VNTAYARRRAGHVAPMLRTIRDDRGQGLGEYALILGFIAVLCIAAVAFVGTQLLGYYQDVGSKYP
jgi:Flp pilus assembly pilin Flp